ALCGSSARKVRRGHANLLGGRALRYELFGLTASELGSDFNLETLLNRDYLPALYTSSHASRALRSYVAGCLREEIAAEALVRNLPAFSRFLDVAALSDKELVNMANIARETGVSNHTVASYFEILVDTMLGRWLPAYRNRPKRRVIEANKFYFADFGVVNVLAKRSTVEPGSELFGKAMENWLMHELTAFDAYEDRGTGWSYWRLASGVEVDFVAQDLSVAIESKVTEKARDDHFRGLRELKVDQVRSVNSFGANFLRDKRTSRGSEEKLDAGGGIEHNHVVFFVRRRVRGTSPGARTTPARSSRRWRSVSATGR
ncbi:MAG: DUF4143 domain-containing protein, partial [Clostridia bacterium]|nr:DUF4143 domain-containing protein [Deltaproteobacteria bacterium]